MKHGLRRRSGIWLPPLAVGVAAALIVFHQLDFSLWYDEAFSFGLARQSWHTFLGQYTWGTEANMVLYYLVLRAWLWVTSAVGILPTEVVVRLPSAVFAVASAVMVYLLGRRLFGPIAGLVAAALFVTNFLQLLLAQTARAYSLQMLLLTISWYCLVAALQDPVRRRRWLIGLVVANTLAVYADLFSALVIVSQVVAVVALLLIPGPWRASVRGSGRSLAFGFALVGFLVIPITLDAALHGGPNNWVAPAHLEDIRSFFLYVSGDNRINEALVLGAALLGGLVALLRAVAPQWLARINGLMPDALGSAVALGSWFVIPIALSFALTQPSLNLHLFFHRYLIVVVPPLCLLAGLGAVALRLRPVQLLLAVALTLVAWPQVPEYYRTAEVQDFRDPIAWVQTRYRAGDGLICDPVVECGLPVPYYLDRIPGRAHFDADSPGRYIWPTTTWVPVDQERVLAYAQAHQRVFLIFEPLVNRPAAYAEGNQLAAALAARFQKVDQMTAHVAQADATVLLYSVGP